MTRAVEPGVELERLTKVRLRLLVHPERKVGASDGFANLGLDFGLTIEPANL